MRSSRIVATIVTALALMAAYAVPAQAATTGTLKVKVTVLETGAPAPAGCVTAVDWAGYHVATKVCTTTSGAYSFTGLAVGTYKLVFAFSGFPTQELTPDTSGYSVTTLRVTAGATTASAYGLVPNHSISGKLTDTANAPLDAVTVAAVPVQGTAGSEVLTTTRADGSYLLQPPVGYYRIEYRPGSGLAHVAYPGGALNDAYIVGYESITHLPTIKLVPGGQLEGTLHVPNELAGAANACMVVYEWRDAVHTPLGSACGPVGSVVTVAGLYGYTYAVCVAATPITGDCTPSGGYWLQSIHGGKGDFQVTGGATTTVPFAFGGVLSVTATLDNGKAVTSGCLTAAELIARGATPDCSPVGGVFHLAAKSDYYGTATLALTGVPGVNSTLPVTVSTSAGTPSSVSAVFPAVGTSSLTVHLAYDDARSFSGGCLRLTLHASPTQQTVKATQCNLPAGGVVVFSNLPDGDYSVEAIDLAGTFERIAYPNHILYTSYDLIPIAPGADVAVNMTLPTTQLVTGTVTDPADAPIAGLTVTARAPGGVITEVTTGADGTYALTVPVRASKVRVTAPSGLGSVWLGGSASYSQAATVSGPHLVPVAAMGTTKLAAAVSATGTIVVPDTANYDQACVIALDESLPLEYARDCGAVGDTFSLPGLAAGPYRICVVEAPAADGCAPDDPQAFMAVGPGSNGSYSVGPDATIQTLAFGGTLTVAFDDMHLATPTGCVDLVVDSSVVATDCAAVNDKFTLTWKHELNVATATVQTRDIYGYYDKSFAAYVPSGGRTQSTWAYVSAKPVISGTIKIPTGFANVHRCVRVTDLDTYDKEVCLEPGKQTYSIPVDPGMYYVEFFSQEPELAYQWYPNSPTVAGAKQVRVRDDVTTTGVSATLIQAGRISGTVTGPAGEALADVCVDVYSSSGHFMDNGCTDEVGHYAFESLTPGKYRLRFESDSGLAERWAGGGATYSTATWLTVTAGATRVVNQQLFAGGSISGEVSYAGAPASGGCVTAYSTNGEYIAEDCAVDGSYEIVGIATGSYVVRFTGFDGGADQWSGGVNTFSNASVIGVVAGATATLSAELAQGGTISGRLTSDDLPAGTKEFRAALVTPEGETVAWADVSAVQDDEGYVNATYEFTNVPAGAYKVAIESSQHYVRAWYRTAGSFAPATVTMPNGSSWSLTADVDPTTSGALSGSLNVPASWSSPTVCAVALNHKGTAVASDCGPKASSFELSVTGSFDYYIVFTNGLVTSAAQYTAFTGTKKFFGNTTSLTSARYFHVDYHQNIYAPIWFFPDVTYKTPHIDAIQWMGDQGIFTGYSDGTFKPSNTLTRQDLALYLYRLAGSPAVTLPATSPFTDVKASASPTYTAIVWLRQRGAVSGTTFSPTSAVTRMAEAVILYKVAGSPAVTLPTKSPYKDVAKSNPAFKAVYWAAKYSIVPKATSTTFAPNNSVKRYAGAASLYEWWWRVG